VDVELYSAGWEIRAEGLSETPTIRLTKFILHPTFNSLSSIILRECMRQLNTRMMLYIYAKTYITDGGEKVSTDNLPLTVQDYFIQLKPKALSVQDSTLNTLQNEQAVHAFYRNETLRTPPFCNLRTLIVGASTCGRALAAELCSQNEYRFENLMMLAPSIHCSHQTEYTPRNREQYTLYSLHGSRVHTVVDALFELDHKKKVVTTKTGMQIEYDILILTPGMQVVNPNPGTKFVFTVSSEDMDVDQDLYDFFSSYALKLPVVIHGSGLEALTAIQGVVEKFSCRDNIVWLCDKSENDVT